jgi:hypothetical protein
MNERDSFELPRRIEALFNGIGGPWYVAGGWALDLYLERVTRPHGDIEVLISREHQELIHRQFRSNQLNKMVPSLGGGTEEPWPVNHYLELPIHQIRVRLPEMAFDIFLGDFVGEMWTYRRDPRITRLGTQIGGKGSLNVPFLMPEIVLLFKAKNPASKDDGDFLQIADRLSDCGARWLLAALQTAHPTCPWIELLVMSRRRHACKIQESVDEGPRRQT